MAIERFFPKKRVFPKKKIKGFFPTREWVFPNKTDTDTDTEVQTEQGRLQEATGRPQEGHRKATGFSPKTGRRRGKLEAGGILYV